MLNVTILFGGNNFNSEERGKDYMGPHPTTRMLWSKTEQNSGISTSRSGNRSTELYNFTTEKNIKRTKPSEKINIKRIDRKINSTATVCILWYLTY